MEKFKIGDKVKLKENEFDWYDVKNLIGTVIQVNACNYADVKQILVEFEKEVWCGHSGDGRGKKKRCLYFTPESLEKINKINKKVIFNDNRTIYINGKNKFIAKCNEKDNFDNEKGLLMCIAREAGYTYDDVKNLIENSINNMPIEVNRKAKVGDYIKIVNATATDGLYKNGDILYVTGVGIRGVICKNIEFLIYHTEYVVLENYKLENKNV